MIEIDKQKMEAFWQKRAMIANPRLATNYRDDGRLSYDRELVLSQLKQGGTILDLGAGTCTLAVELEPHASRIVAVDKVGEFFHGVSHRKKIECVVSDVTSFQVDEKFDAVLLFGVVNFITSDDEDRLYAQVRKMVNQDGVFIVKNQCGVRQEIVVDKYSEELEAEYHARYPFVDTQEEKLAKFFGVERVDIYPESINRWSNTHFYAFVCSPK